MPRSMSQARLCKYNHSLDLIFPPFKITEHVTIASGNVPILYNYRNTYTPNVQYMYMYIPAKASWKHCLQNVSTNYHISITKRDKLPSPITYPICLFLHKIKVWKFFFRNWIVNSRLSYIEDFTSDPHRRRVTGKGFLKGS